MQFLAEERECRALRLDLFSSAGWLAIKKRPEVPLIGGEALSVCPLEYCSPSRISARENGSSKEGSVTSHPSHPWTRPTFFAFCRPRRWLIPDGNCFTVVWEDASEIPATQELRQLLEKGTDEVKLDTLRKIIVASLNGNPQVRRYCSPSQTTVEQAPFSHSS